MKVISDNAGLLRTVQCKGNAVSAAIFKTRAFGRICLWPFDSGSVP